MGAKTLNNLLKDLQVTAFVDYREFLEELYRRARDQEAGSYSYEAYAADLGFAATNVIRLVIMRKRALATSSALTIVKALGLKHENRKYFLAAVRYVNARSTKVREQYFRKMLDAKQACIVSHRDKDQLAFLSDWYHWVVLEMLRLEGAKVTPEWLSAQMSLSVPPEKIRRSLLLLEAIGLLVTDEPAGTARLAQGSPMVIPSDATTARLAMAQHHRSMIENAKQALAKLPLEQLDFNALTMSVSYATYKEMQEKTKRFCEEIMAMEAREQSRECVAQLNTNLFPLTKWKAR